MRTPNGDILEDLLPSSGNVISNKLFSSPSPTMQDKNVTTTVIEMESTKQITTQNTADPQQTTTLSNTQSVDNATMSTQSVKTSVVFDESTTSTVIIKTSGVF